VVDTLGLVFKVIVTAGNVQDRDGAKTLLEEISTETDLVKRLELIWADGSYRDELISWVEETPGWKLEIVEKPKETCQRLRAIARNERVFHLYRDD
jgi:transposase